MKTLSEVLGVGKLVGSRGAAFRRTSTSKPDDWKDHSGKDVGAMRNFAHEKAAVDKAEAAKREREAKVEKRNRNAVQRAKETLRMAKENIDEVKGKWVQDRPMKFHVAAMEKRDTADLKGMHDRWSSDHKDKKSDPSTSERLLAVHHVLKKRGESVPDLPKHRNLGITKYFDEGAEATGTAARVKIKNVARLDDEAPTSEKSKLSKTGEIKTKTVDEDIAASISRKYGLSASMLEAARSVMEKKTQVDMDPETDDKEDNGDDDDVKKESKHTTPKSDKEKKLAALAHPKDKITHKDVLVGRGVLRKEETEIEEKTLYGNPAELKRQLDQLAKREKALPAGISPARKALAIQKQKLQKAHSAAMGMKKEDLDVDSLTEEQLEEVLKKSQPAGEWIKDFVHSKDPKFAGKSKKERMKMALGAYYAKQRNEEVEEVDEAIKPYVSYSAGGTGKSPSATVMAANEKPHKTFTKTEHGHDYKQKALDYFKKHGNKLKENVEFSFTEEEIERLEAIAAQLDEAKPTIVSAPIRGANQDQSGFGVKSNTADYTISDSKKVKVKEEAELEEGRGRPKKSGDEAEGDDTAKHPIQQLHKIAAGIQGNEPHFEHKDGSKTKVSKQLAKHITAVYGSMRTTQDKEDFANKLHANRQSMMTAVDKHVR